MLLPKTILTFLILLGFTKSMLGAALDLNDLELFDPNTIDTSTSQSLNATSGTLIFDLENNAYTYTDSSNNVTTGAGLTITTSAGTYSTFVFDDLVIGSGVTVDVIEPTTWWGYVGDPERIALVSQTDMVIQSDISVDSALFNESNGGIVLVADGTLTLDATLSTSGSDSAFLLPDGQEGGGVTLAADTIVVGEDAVIEASGGEGGNGSDGGEVNIYASTPLDNLPSIENDNGDGTPNTSPNEGVTVEYDNVPDFIAVPEPSTSSFLAISGTFLLLKRRRTATS